MSPVRVYAEAENAPTEQGYIDRRTYRDIFRSISRAYKRIGAFRGRWARRRPRSLLLAGNQHNRFLEPAVPDPAAPKAYHRISTGNGAEGSCRSTEEGSRHALRHLKYNKSALPSSFALCKKYHESYHLQYYHGLASRQSFRTKWRYSQDQRKDLFDHAIGIFTTNVP